MDPMERTFLLVVLEVDSGAASLTSGPIGQSTEQLSCALHTLEGALESAVIGALGVADDIDAVYAETGRPVGCQAMMAGYDSLPPALDGIAGASRVSELLSGHERRHPSGDEIGRLRLRLSSLYAAGPGGRVVSAGDEAPVAASSEGGESEELDDVGGRIVMPAQTFIEALSQELEIHPISVYWLLKEMREKDGLVSPPELKRHLEDYVSVTILRLLGYRWPEQDAYEREHRPILDPALVDEDGIIPLVVCADQPTAGERVRQRLERQFGEQGAAQSLREFRQWVGRDLDAWLRRDFFKRHVQQFKQRPIAWHFVSPERHFEAFVLYHRLSRATLATLRTVYAGGLVERLRAEQERARQANAGAEVSRLQLAIEDVEEFRARLEAIERGDELKYRIRCRWKGEEATGRPGPYAPDIDDGVKVNIRPFQEAGLLAMREVIKKW
jgi:hypothetical protein